MRSTRSKDSTPRGKIHQEHGQCAKSEPNTPSDQSRSPGAPLLLTAAPLIAHSPVARGQKSALLTRAIETGPIATNNRRISGAAAAPLSLLHGRVRSTTCFEGATPPDGGEAPIRNGWPRKGSNIAPRKSDASKWRRMDECEECEERNPIRFTLIGMRPTDGPSDGPPWVGWLAGWLATEGIAFHTHKLRRAGGDGGAASATRRRFFRYRRGTCDNNEFWDNTRARTARITGQRWRTAEERPILI